jgi:hypothetical protein
MPIYTVTVQRMQVWNLEVEADNAESAKEKAEHEASHEEAHDDYAYQTRAKEKQPCQP